MGLGLTIVGGGITWASATLKDDEGYYTTKTLRIDRDSYAVVTKPADIHLGSAWGWDLGDLVRFKVEGSNNDPLKNIFIGVAPESNITDYLRNVTYDEVVGFHINPDELVYQHHSGNLTPVAPTNETFWEDSVNGTGNQTLYWELETGRWVFAVMNADGSQDVNVSVTVGAKIPWLFPLGLSFLVVGIVGLAAGPVMIGLAVRRPRGPTK